jgi:1,4-dihydroxy-2-naphthoyl-CoA hydrolase
MSFEASFSVRFQDVDAGGVLFFGRIYDYCHQAYEEFVAAQGVDRAFYFAGAEYLVPIVHSEADYRIPIRHGERIRVQVLVARVGRASFTLRYRVLGPDGDTRVEVMTVHAFVKKATMKPIAIPDDLRAIFRAHLIEEPAPHHAA